MSDGLEPREGEQMTQKRQAANLNGVRGTDTGVAGGCSSPSTRTKFKNMSDGLEPREGEQFVRIQGMNFQQLLLENYVFLRRLRKILRIFLIYAEVAQW